MALEFFTTDKASVAQGIKMAIYGRSGVGKTTLARTALAPFILSAEAGLLSLSNVAIPGAKIKSVDDLTEAYNWFKNVKEARQFKTIFIDSVSEIAEVILANAKKQVKDPRQAYGELIEKTMMMVRAFRDLEGFNVVMLFKQESSDDEVTKIKTYGPSLPGAKLGNQIPYMFDEVLRMGIGKTPDGREYRFLQTQPDIQYEAKDRSGRLALIEPPDLSLVFAKILGQNSPT